MPDRAAQPIAGWGHRAAALLIDLSLAGLVGLVFERLTEAELRDSDASANVFAMMAAVTWVLNTTVVVGLTRGQTVGKHIAGTRIMRQDGRPARFLTGFVRDTLAAGLCGGPFVFLVDAFVVLGETRQSVRDRIVRTWVVQEPDYAMRRAVLIVTTVVLVVAWASIAVVNNA